MTGEATCRFPNAVLPAPGRNYPNPQNCTPSGASYDPTDPTASGADITNSVCLLDSDIQPELRQMVTDMGLIGRTQSGYTPLLAVMLPPGVEVCVDGGTWCSVNSAAAQQFCSYHSYLSVDGHQIAYSVLPWSAYTTCDPVNVPALRPNPTPVDLATDAGVRMVSALSRSQIAAISDPWLNAWFSQGNAEIDDRCPRPDVKVDTHGMGGGSYTLAREFNNAGMIESDPNAPFCAPLVDLGPTFVAPSPIDPGDVVTFDGSVTDSTLMIPQAGYQWDFGDGTPPQYGASLVHTFAKAGVYTVTLTVTDRGDNKASFSQKVTVGKPKSGGGGGGGRWRRPPRAFVPESTPAANPAGPELGRALGHRGSRQVQRGSRRTRHAVDLAPRREPGAYQARPGAVSCDRSRERSRHQERDCQAPPPPAAVGGVQASAPQACGRNGPLDAVRVRRRSHRPRRRRTLLRCSMTSAGG